MWRLYLQYDSVGESVNLLSSKNFKKCKHTYNHLKFLEMDLRAYSKCRIFIQKNLLKFGKSHKNQWYLNQDSLPSLVSHFSEIETPLQTCVTENTGLPVIQAPS